MSHAAFIPTKARADLVRKTIWSWVDTEVDPNLVVEPQDVEAYEEMLFEEDLEDEVTLRIMKKNDQGICYARNQCVRFATKDGHDGFIMSDDDLEVEPGISALAEFIEEDEQAAGVGFMHRLHMLWMGVEFDTGPHPTAGGTAQNCIGLSTKKMRDTKGYIPGLGPYDDSDMIFQLVKAGYGPWYLHSDAHGRLVGQRYQPGGISEMEKNAKQVDRKEKENRLYEILVREHGEEYFGWHRASKHLREQGLDKVIRFRWKRFYRDHNPEAYEILYG